MKKLQFLFKTLMLCIALTFIGSLPSYATNNPDPWADPDSNDVPVDGGLSLFIAAGVGYGIKKAKDLKKRKQLTSEDFTELEK
jgi:hypothetical protein